MPREVAAFDKIFINSAINDQYVAVKCWPPKQAEIRFLQRACELGIED